MPSSYPRLPGTRLASFAAVAHGFRLRPRLTAALAAAAFVWSATHADAQQTRAEEVDAARDKRAAETRPEERSKIERFLFKLEDDLLIERIFSPPRGVYLRLGGVGESSGFGGGPAYRYNTPKFDFNSVVAATYRKYTLVEASLRFPGTLAQDAYFQPSGPYVQLLGRRYDAPQEDFFGLGPDSAESARSNYALVTTHGAVTGGWTRRNFKAGVTAAYHDPDIGPGTDTRMPSSDEVFSPEDVPGLAGAPEFFVLGPFLEWQTRDRSENDASGGEYRASWNRYRDQTASQFSFQRWDVDLRQYISFTKRTHTLALRAWAASATEEDGNEVPFYLMPTLGGGQMLRGYRIFRYRDRSLLLLQGEFRWRVNEFVTGALFYDTGAVAPELGDLGRLERDYGFGLRMGGRMGSAVRIDVAFGGREGTRLVFRFDDAF